METPLYEAWLERIDSYYQETFAVNIIEAFCQYGGGNNETREGKGKVFGAGYEVFIYAFFIGLYSGERRPLIGPKKKFRMRMRDWGNVNPNAQKGRKKYTKIQGYIFMALVAKSDIDFIALDKGELSVDDACNILMTTLNEYTNQGLFMIRAKMQDNPGFFYGNTDFIDFLKAVINKDDSAKSVVDSLISRIDSVPESKDNEETVFSIEAPKSVKKKTSRWTMAEDKALEEYFNGGIEIEKLAVIFEREEECVRERLIKKGLIK